jgi:hypothetical protein
LLDVITDVIPVQYQKHVQSLMSDIPWYWESNTSYQNDSEEYYQMQKLQYQYPNIIDNGQFTHIVLENGNLFSSNIGFFIPLLYLFADKAKVTVKDILRIRINLMVQDKTFTNKNYNYPHTDVMPSKAFLYYVNDSDGDTILFNETAMNKGDAFPKQFNIIKRVTPVAGTGVFFDSNRYHASSSPAVHACRYVINFNFT